MNPKIGEPDGCHWTVSSRHFGNVSRLRPTQPTLQLDEIDRTRMLTHVLVNSTIRRQFSSLMNETRSLIAVCQLTSTNDLEANFEVAKGMMKRAKERKAKIVFFPECFDYIGQSREESEMLALTDSDNYIGRYRNCAEEYGLWLSLGGFHQKDPTGLRKPFITHLIIDDKGTTRGVYRKLHLFDLDIAGEMRLIESEFSSRGNKISEPVCTPVGNVAMSICYDLRFAELALWYRMNGAHILTYPAAFTVNTGLAHWETLLKARAIETQCYVVAAAQIGKHNDKRSSYGHSMVVDPWGAIVAQCSETIDMCFAEISLSYLSEVRKLQPVFDHRRSDLYTLIAVQRNEIGNEMYIFGDHRIPSEHVFYRSTYTFCFVNRNPVLPGHVLICPIRNVKRLTGLNHAETSDLFITAKRIQAMLEDYYKTTSSTVCVQDGPEAGQTVSHLHVHILPRKKDDLGDDPDNVYRELAEHDKTKEKQFREKEEMKNEANIYRCLLAECARYPIILPSHNIVHQYPGDPAGHKFDYIERCSKRTLQLAALAFCFIGLYSIFSAMNQERRSVDNGSDPFASYKSYGKKDWHDYESMKRDAVRQGLGEGGKPVVIASKKLKKLRDSLYRSNGYDAYISDLIALDRSIKDIRHSGCKSMVYLEKLPSVGVVLPFHNEHNSTLLRSVYSVINRSPKDVMKEIILVDDGSTKPFLKGPLEKFLKKADLNYIVKVIRTQKREGLIRARQIGARHTTADVIVFLDAHSEANYNWLPPLIEPIALNYKTVVCPFVDVIDCDTYEYRAQDEGGRGSFDWEFNYKRLPLTEDSKKNPTHPFRNPVMAGGYFAISRKWFWELEGYDEGLEIWGGEQYELSFKVWQCHGTLIDVPCSRVGHIYRCKYIPFPNPGIGDFISRNYRRVAEVWMDEYAEFLYKRRPPLLAVDFGDLSKQKAVRKRLKCKSFEWFMKEIAFDQEKFYPAVEPEDSAKGELRNIAANKCVDTQFKDAEKKFGLCKCISDNPLNGGEQNLRLTFWHDVRLHTRTMCFDVSLAMSQAPIVLFPCHGMQGNQHFKYLPDKQQMYHPISGLCMDYDAKRGEIFMNPCDSKRQSQKWAWTKINLKLIEERNKKA
ncbi:putative polypeptide N-acetylgalactosaminyltransferase [Dirofilaria immitis]